MEYASSTQLCEFAPQTRLGLPNKFYFEGFGTTHTGAVFANVGTASMNHCRAEMNVPA